MKLAKLAVVLLCSTELAFAARPTHLSAKNPHAVQASPLESARLAQMAVPSLKATAKPLKAPAKPLKKAPLKTPAKKAPLKKAPVKAPLKAPAKKAPLKKAPAKKVELKAPAKKAPLKKAPAKKVELKAPAKKVELKTPAKKAPLKKAPAKKVELKTPAKKAPAKAPLKKAPAKAPLKKAPAKAPLKKAPAKKVELKASPETEPKSSLRLQRAKGINTGDDWSTAEVVLASVGSVAAALGLSYAYERCRRKKKAGASEAGAEKVEDALLGESGNPLRF